MNFNPHYDLEGRHAPFSASSPSWLRYDDAKLLNRYSSMQAAAFGSRLHEWAKETIDLGIKQAEVGKTINMYVNDAIAFGMKTEVVLFFSKFFFGTADTIAFRNNFLRIHDLKTGEHPATREQLMVYAALFCLEYKIRPEDINIELRIYQSNKIDIWQPTAAEIAAIMANIVHKNNVLEKREEV